MSTETDLLYCIALPDESENTDLLPELLYAAEFTDLSSRLDAESGKLVHTLYFLSEEARAEAMTAILRLRADWESLGAVFGEPELGTLQKEDWAESWKIHFKPIEISETLAVTPYWIDLPEKEGRTVIVLNPGLSFGTGQHATTKFCLGQIDRYAKTHDVSASSLLDAGCGSGILAIAAKKLGFGTVEAFDIDPEAVEISKENTSLNHLTGIRYETSPLIEFNSGGRQFDVVAANILSSALLAGKEKLLSLLKPGGTLILAGILDTEYPVIRDAFQASGCREQTSAVENLWRGGLFLR